MLDRKVFRVGHDFVRRYPGARSDNVCVRYLHARPCPKDHGQCHGGNDCRETNISLHVSLRSTWRENCAWYERYDCLRKSSVMQFTDALMIGRNNQLVDEDIKISDAQPRSLSGI